MSIGVFEEPRAQAVIERFGSADKIGVFVGAGASVEAGLPTWEQLVQRLLDRAAREAKLFPKQPKNREAWVSSMLRVESLLGAASVAQVELGEKLPEVLQEELYGTSNASTGTPPGRAEHYSPGPIAEQIAHLRVAFDNDPDHSMNIYTTNYDDLIEVALRNEAKLARKYTIYPYVRPGGRVSHPLGVRHLHGYVGRDKTIGPFTLAEESYLDKNPAAFWQEAQVVSELNEARCLFLGTSLTDPNLIHYLYEHHSGPNKSERNAIVFVRQAEIYDVPEFVRKAREDFAIKRWGPHDLDVIFLDHYSDVAQLLHEIATRHRAADAKGYTSLATRASQYFTRLDNTVLRASNTIEFRKRQQDLNEALCDVQAEAVSTMKRSRKHKADLSSEHGLTLGLWLLTDKGARLTLCGATDRIWCDIEALQTLDLNPRDRWVAVKAFCDGKYTEMDWGYDNSRWSYVLGIPLWTEKTSPYGRIPIGVMTLSTQTPSNKTKLAQLDYSQRALLGRTLAVTTLQRMDELAS
jgi:hypothetical protein